MHTAQALQDLRAFELLESLTDYEFVVGLIDENLETPITFKDYPRNNFYLLNLRKRVNEEIVKRL